MFRNSKKMMLVSISLVLVLLLAACGGGSTNTSGNTSSNTSGGSSSGGDSGAVEEILVEIALSPGPDSVQNRGVLEMGDQVNERLQSAKLDVVTFPGNQLGGGEQQLEAVGQGTINGVANTTAFLNSIEPIYGIFDLPFLFPDMEAVLDFVETEHGQALLDRVENKGYKGLAFWPHGFKKMTANDPINTMEDLSGLKFRTLPSSILIGTYESWGASAISLPLPELYNALTQGTVDAEENTMGVIYDFKLFEAQKYIIDSDHSLTTNMYLVNKEWFDGLPQEVQDIMTEEAKAIGKLVHKWENERLASLVEDIKAEGKSEFITLSDAEKERLREAAQPVYDAFIAEFPEAKEIIEFIEATY